MPLTNGSGSGSCYFRHWPSRCQQKTIFNTIFYAYYFLKVHFHHFSKIKRQKESLNSRNQGFSYYFCMMIEGSGSGSISLTSGSGSWRPKNMWIRIQIRIRNTVCNTKKEGWSLFISVEDTRILPQRGRWWTWRCTAGCWSPPPPPPPAQQPQQQLSFSVRKKCFVEI